MENWSLFAECLNSAKIDHPQVFTACTIDILRAGGSWKCAQSVNLVHLSRRAFLNFHCGYALVWSIWANKGYECWYCALIAFWNLFLLASMAEIPYALKWVILWGESCIRHFTLKTIGYHHKIKMFFSQECTQVQWLVFKFLLEKHLNTWLAWGKLLLDSFHCFS